MFFRPIAISLSPNANTRDVLVVCALLINPLSYIKGDSVAKLEQWFKDYFKSSYSVSFASGRAALFAVLKGLEIGIGDEVIIQAFTCVAVPNAILATGAKPVYTDIDSSFTMNSNYLEKSISKKTKAIVVQHTFGIESSMEKILKIAKKHNIAVVEDSAHTIGGEINGKKLGTFAVASIFSLGRDKSFSSVAGGMAITSNTSLGKKIIQVQKEFAYPSVSWTLSQLFHPIAFLFILPIYNVFSLGKLLLVVFQKIGFLTFPVLPKEKKGLVGEEFVKKLPNALAVLALHQLKKIDTFNNKRSYFVGYYQKELSNIPEYTLPYKKVSPLLRFPILCENRDVILQRLKKKGIYIGKWYSEIIDPKGVDYKTVCYKPGSCSYTEFVAGRILNLPTYPNLTKKQAHTLVTLLKSYA